MCDAVEFSKPKMIVKIAISTTIELYCVYWFFLSALGTGGDFTSNLRLMDFHVFASGHELEIFYPVILFVLVYVMDNFIWAQKTSDMFFYYKDMFANVLTVRFCSRMANGAHQYISAIARFSSAPIWELFRGISEFYKQFKFPCFAIAYSPFRNFAARFSSVWHREIIT